MNSIGLSCNVFNDALALAGMLENAQGFFDDIFVIHAGPGGKKSTDGTIEILEKFGVRHVFADIMDGFGVIRTRLVQEGKTDWIYISDADERYYPLCENLTCEGTEKFPDQPNPNLKVKVAGQPHNSGALLKSLISGAGDHDAIVTCRRHWFDFTMRRPAQNWLVNADWQCRILKNRPWVGYSKEVKLHERVVDARTGRAPKMIQGRTDRWIYHEHAHNFYKPLHPEKNAEDMATYRALSEAGAKGMWLEQQPGVKA